MFDRQMALQRSAKRLHNRLRVAQMVSIGQVDDLCIQGIESFVIAFQRIEHIGRRHILGAMNHRQPMPRGVTADFPTQIITQL